MNEGLRGRSSVAEGMDVRDDVVPEPSLIRSDHIEVDVIEPVTHLRNGFRGNLYAELPLRLGQREPQAAPQAVADSRRPELQHRRRRVPVRQRRGIAIVLGHRTLKYVCPSCPLRSNQISITLRPAK